MKRTTKACFSKTRAILQTRTVSQRPFFPERKLGSRPAAQAPGAEPEVVRGYSPDAPGPVHSTHAPPQVAVHLRDARRGGRSTHAPPQVAVRPQL